MAVDDLKNIVPYQNLYIYVQSIFDYAVKLLLKSQYIFFKLLLVKMNF